jgi:hypothetical protein
MLLVVERRQVLHSVIGGAPGLWSNVNGKWSNCQVVHEHHGIIGQSKARSVNG